MMQLNKVCLFLLRMTCPCLHVLCQSLRKSIRVRLNRWHEFRRHIALRCKIYFQYHLSNRGYFGKVLFDHIHGTLQLKVRFVCCPEEYPADRVLQVQTDDQLATQAGSREKDPNALSGGEKSFSTICLLLSLWESIGCPIRCLGTLNSSSLHDGSLLISCNRRIRRVHGRCQPGG